MEKSGIPFQNDKDYFFYIAIYETDLYARLGNAKSSSIIFHFEYVKFYLALYPTFTLKRGFLENLKKLEEEVKKNEDKTS